MFSGPPPRWPVDRTWCSAVPDRVGPWIALGVQRSPIALARGSHLVFSGPQPRWPVDRTWCSAVPHRVGPWIALGVQPSPTALTRGSHLVFSGPPPRWPVDRAWCSAVPHRLGPLIPCQLLQPSAARHHTADAIIADVQRECILYGACQNKHQQQCFISADHFAMPALPLE